MSEPKARCYTCETRQADTTLVPAKIGGDYRRAPRNGHVRVCRNCTQDRVDRAVTDGSALNTGRIKWARAADAFGITIPDGTLIDHMTGRRQGSVAQREP